MLSKSQYLHFLPRMIWKKGLPIQLIFFVTAKCNLRCKHCFYWKEVKSASNMELSLNEIKKIAENSHLKLLWLSLTGGEPFIRTDLADIAKYFCDFGKVANISIPTNGQLEEQTIEATKRIINNCPNSYLSISVSLDGMGRQHDSIRGKDKAFDKAVSTFIKLRKLKEYYNFGLSVQTTIMEDNQKNIKSLYKFVRDELKPDFINLNLIRGNPQNKTIKKVNIKYYQDLVKLMKNDVQKGMWQYFNFPFSKLALKRNFMVYEQVAKVYKEEKFLIPCYSLNLSGVISEKGDVYPCEVLDNSKIGNLRDVNYDLSKLWFSPQSEKLRAAISQKCYCTYECALSVNTMFNPKLIIKNSINTIINR